MSEIIINTETVVNSLSLSGKIERSKVLRDTSPEANEKAKAILKHSFGSREYESVDQMIRLSRDPGHTVGGVDDDVKKDAQRNLTLLGTAMCLTEKGAAIDLVLAANLSPNLPDCLVGIEEYVVNNALISGPTDETGKFIAKKICVLETISRKAAVAPTIYGEKFAEETAVVVDALFEKSEEVDSSSDDYLKLGAVMGSLDTALKVRTAPVVGVPDDENVDMDALLANRYAAEDGEHRSPFETTPESFVDSIYNYQDPYLHFTPPPEWVRKLSGMEQYKLKIEMKLARGAARKQSIHAIDASEARKNEVYNLPELELKLMYEMPYVRESLETFMGDLLETYEEDGRVFCRLKQEKLPDGSYRLNDKGFTVIDPDVKIKLGNSGDDEERPSFEFYKDEIFLKMALKKLNPTRVGDIDSDWKGFYKNTIDNYIHQQRERFKLTPGNEQRVDKRTDAELEKSWQTKYALEEKKAVATAWNLLFVGNTLESADVQRQLTPSHVCADKIRTMMMPLEKFIQKLGIKKGADVDFAETFGIPIFNWAKNRYQEEGEVFAKKLIKAACTDRNKLTDEEAQWRLFPKRLMCSFTDNWVVKTESGEKMTMSQALLNKEKIKFSGTDLDVFVSLRDTWDEVISITPFFVGKAEGGPMKNPDQFAGMVQKLTAVVLNIEKIQSTEEERNRIRGITGLDKKFVSEQFTENPEFYAWLLAGAIGLENDLDIPVLRRTSLNKAWHYDVNVGLFASQLGLSPEKTAIFKKILTASGRIDSARQITKAEWRVASRNSRRLKEEKKFK